MFGLYIRESKNIAAAVPTTPDQRSIPRVGNNKTPAGNLLAQEFSFADDIDEEEDMGPKSAKKRLSYGVEPVVSRPKMK